MEPKDAQPITVEAAPPPEPDNLKRARGIIILGEEDPTQLDEQTFKDKAPLFHASKSPDFHVDETFDYGADQQAEGMTLGRGLYATSSRDRATEYMVHGASESQDRVFPLMPYQARMLDLRQVGDPSQNAAVPKEIVDQWVAFARPQIEARLQEWQGDISKAISRRALNRLIVRFQHLSQRDDVDLRSDILGTWDPDAQVATPGSQVADIWDAFCKEQNIDGIIYNEGGEMQFADTPDTTYVFNNLSKVGTYDDWKRRISSTKGLSIEDEEKLTAVRAHLAEFDQEGNAERVDQYNSEEQMIAARTFFESMGIPIGEDGLISQDLSPEQVAALQRWRNETFIDSIDMMDEETFYRKTLLAVSLWRQRGDGSINYLLGKGVGLEVSVRGQVKGRVKRPNFFSYRSHSDFELYDVHYEHDAQGGNISGRSPYPDSFKAVFGGQEYFPPTKTKGLRNLPEGFLDETAEVVDVGGVEMLVPQLELQFLDKWEKAGSHDRPEGTDAEVLARQYDLDLDRVHDYLDRFVIEPAKQEALTSPKYDPQLHFDRVTRLISSARSYLVESGVEQPTMDQIIAKVNTDMRRNIDIHGADSDTRISGVRVKLWQDLSPEQVGEGDRITDTALIEQMTQQLEAEKREATSRLAHKHGELDELFLKITVDQAIEERHMPSTIDALPPLREGYVRVVHTTNPRSVIPIMETGLDYEKFGMIDSTVRPVQPDVVESYYVSDPRFNYPTVRTIVFDLPASELATHRRFGSNPGVLSSNHIVGVIDGYKKASDNK